MEHKGIQEWVKTFVKNTNLSGLVCFDFLVDKDDNVYCIECNPRLHSAIVSFESQTKVSRKYFLCMHMFYSLDKLKLKTKTKNQIFVVVDISNFLYTLNREDKKTFFPIF